MELLQQPIMEAQQLTQILENRQAQMLTVAQKMVKDIANTEMNLFNFEMMLGLNTNNSDRKRLTRLSRNLRNETHKELLKLSNNNFGRMNMILNNF